MEKDAIKSTLNNYAKAYCSKDLDGMMQIFDDSDNISVIGTGADELCVGRGEIKELFKKNFEAATATEFNWDWIDVRISGDHAVVSTTLTIHLVYLGSQLIVPLRWTVVLKKENDRWVWIHRNASVPATGQENGAAYPKDKQN